MKRKFQTSWTEAEIAVLKECYPVGGSPAVMARLRELGLRPRTKSSIGGTAFHHGLKSGLLHKRNAGCFLKGMTPPNKRKTMSAEMRERVKHTWFKKGEPPQNQLEYDLAISYRRGKHRMNNDYWYIKMAVAVWDHLHVWCYLQYHKDPPPKHLIRMKDKAAFDALVRSFGFPEKPPKQEPDGHWETLKRFAAQVERDGMLECISMKQNVIQNSASIRLTDGYVAKCIAWRDKELEEAIKRNPQLLDLKRQQLLNNRKIKSIQNG